MPVTVTRDQLTAMNPCDLDKRLAWFGRRKALDVRTALAAGATVRDVLWVAQRLGHRDLCARFALLAAQRATVHTTDPRPQACLDAANAYVSEPSDANLVTLRKARAAAADATAYASYAADAADAADAAAYAADAAAYAAQKAEIEAQHVLLIEVLG